jgi:hypothetical protein
VPCSIRPNALSVELRRVLRAPLDKSHMNSTSTTTPATTASTPTTKKTRKQMAKKPLLERIKGKYIVDPESGCHLWIGARCGPDRYPIISSEADGRYPVLVHRQLWIEKNGPIPEAPCHDGSHRYEIHHDCSNGNQCVNSSHHTLMSSREHFAIHKALRAAQPKKTYVKSGKYSRPKKPAASVHIDAATITQAPA